MTFPALFTDFSVGRVGGSVSGGEEDDDEEYDDDDDDDDDDEEEDDNDMMDVIGSSEMLRTWMWIGRGWAGSPPPSFLSIYFSNFDIYLLESFALFGGAVHGFRTMETRSGVTGRFVPLGGGGGGWHLGGWLGGEKAGLLGNTPSSI
ncbi:hypothetical protein BDC45DRAFT_610094 [Circinella umbellata]|nr:hypothetical protein BDC45DRAFT_610094 [Circinella umbellata]